MRRLEVLDGMRGYFLVFMMLNHLTFQGGYRLVKFNHGELGYVQDAQGFVFLSGLLVGMVYAGHMKKRGYAAGAAKVRRRAFELWRWAVYTLLGLGVLALLLPGPQTYWKDWLWQLAEGDPGFAVATALLLYQPTFLDILPQYIVYMIVAPPLVWLTVNGRWRTVAAGSALLWLAVQFGLHLPLAAGIDAAMKLAWPDLVLRAHFNVLAWQVVFMSGLVIGALAATGQIEWKRLFDPERPGPALVALGIVVAFMAFRVGFTWHVVPEMLAERFARLDIRGEFSLVYLANFAAMGYLVAWLMIAGVERARGIAREAGEVLHGIFTLPFLRLLGRHSLHVYVFHVLVIYALKAVDHHQGPMGEPAKTAIALGAIASMALPALWREWRAGRARPAASPAASSASA
jgi:hypothetical protein